MTYFCGENRFGSFPLESVVSVPTSLSDLQNITVGVGRAVYQKKGSEEWFIRGLGISSETPLFAKSSAISKICMTSNCVVGLSESRNILYSSDFTLDSNNDDLRWSTVEVRGDPGSRITDIVTNGKIIYGIDYASSNIYEISSVIGSLKLKWNFEEIQMKKFVCGFGHFILLNDTGALYSWGFGGRGELGHAEHDHAMIQCETPKRIEFFDDLPCIVKDVCCGGWHTLALTSDGDSYSWGWNESGQFGHHYLKEKVSVIGGVPYPIDLGSADDPVQQISCGARHSVAVLKSGKIFSWGLNKHGQLGNHDKKNRSEPVEINLKNNNGEVKVSCGRWTTIIYLY